MSNETTQNKLMRILSKQLGVPEENIKPQSLISTDLGADSLDTAEIAMMIKDDFDYDLSDKDLSQLKTVKDLIDILERSLAKKQ